MTQCGSAAEETVPRGDIRRGVSGGVWGKWGSTGGKSNPQKKGEDTFSRFASGVGRVTRCTMSVKRPRAVGGKQKCRLFEKKEETLGEKIGKRKKSREA